MIFSCTTQPGWWKELCIYKLHKYLPDDNVVADSSTENNTGKHGTSLHESHKFLTSNDRAVLHNFQIHFNRPLPLLLISLPSLLTLAFCPVALLLHPMLVDGFWPPDIFPEPPNVNDVISSFLVPAGLIYAIAFGFAFQEAISKSNKAVSSVEEHLSSLEQISLLAKNIKCLNPIQRYHIFHSLKHEIIQWMDITMGKRYTHFKYTGNTLWLFYLLINIHL